MTTLSRELRAVTFDPSSASGANTIRDRDDELMLDGNGLFNFQRWYSRTPLVYKPNFTSKYFMHNGHLFYWLSGRRPSTCGTGFDQYIVIRCFGRSTKPIKDLLHDIKGFTLTKSAKTTDVYHSTVKGDGAQWHRQSVRPSRPIATVALGEQQKAEIILDINEYLQPATARWYASRGIPYRRGYLLHGPPGTGKTSLSVALAGIFGLSIYCVSLCETGLTESHLATLFDQLPERCVVLLEDVDTAGLRRDSDQSSETLAVAPATMNGKLVMSKSLISLGGLLNVIDGAASQEVSFTIFDVKNS
jgi:chaperone BCS1